MIFDKKRSGLKLKSQNRLNNYFIFLSTGFIYSLPVPTFTFFYFLPNVPKD